MTEGVVVQPDATRAEQRSWQRKLQLALGVVWLVDGLLQLQPFMFTRGANGFSGMLAGTAALTPGSVARGISWSASLVDHHAVLLNAGFAGLQTLLGVGIAWRPTVKAALAASVLWSLAVWWLGEGLGGVLTGNGTPLAGGPGAVLLYALLAVLLWPRRTAAMPFAAAGAIGARWAKVVWTAVWAGLAWLCVDGSGRSSDGISQTIAGLEPGQPGWLLAIDRHAASALDGRGLTVAVVAAALCVLIGAGVHLGTAATRVAVVSAIVLAAVIWVVGENFGMIFPGGATDPNSGPLLALLAVAYWPTRTRATSPATEGAPVRLAVA